MIAIGEPSVRPSNRPDRTSARSGSSRGDVTALCPGRRRSRSRWISSTVNGRRGGQPSTTTPTAPPCDSPKVVTRKICPKVDPIAGSVRKRVDGDKGRLTAYDRAGSQRQEAGKS